MQESNLIENCNDFSKLNASKLVETSLDKFHVWRWEEINKSASYWSHLGSLIDVVQSDNIDLYCLGGFVGRYPLDNSWCKLEDLISEIKNVIVVDGFVYNISRCDNSVSFKLDNTIANYA